MVDVPQRQHDLANTLTDALFGHDQVAAAQNRGRHQEPTHRVGAVAVENLGDIRVVTQGLGHLLTVRAEHNTVADDVLERGAVEERGRQYVQHVEPAAGLTDVLDDEICRVVVLEPFLVLEGVVHLCVGHGAGVEPDVEHVFHAAHGGLAGRVVRVRAGQLVNVRAVQVGFAVLVQGQAAEVCLELFEGAVHVHARVVRVVRNPHGDRGAPEAVTGDGPVACVLNPLAELAVLHVFRDPVDLLVQLVHAVLEVGDLHVPGGDCTVDERGTAAPAVRVGVHVGLLADQHVICLEGVDDGAVRVECLHACNLSQGGGAGGGGLGEEVQELCAFVEGENHGDAVAFTDLLVVFTVGGCLVDDAGTVTGGDVVGDEDLPGGFGAPLFGVREVVPERGVAHVLELGAGVACGDGCVCVLFGLVAFVAEVLGVGAEQLGGDQEGAALELACAGYDGVFNLGSNGERLVGGQGPGGGGPCECFDAVEFCGDLLVSAEGGVCGEAECDGDGLVLAVLVHVVVHAQLVVGEGGLVLPAVGQHAEALVGQALVVEALERPDDGLHVLDVQGLVVVFEVDPACLAGDVLFPLVGVLEHGCAGSVVEVVDAHFEDFALVGHAELLHCLEFCGQAVGVPAEAAFYLVAALGLVACDEVLGVAGEQVAVVGQAVSEGRAVVEDEFVFAVFACGAVLDGCGEGVVLLPVVEDCLFECGELGRCGDAASCGFEGARLGVNMGHVFVRPYLLFSTLRGWGDRVRSTRRPHRFSG